MRGFYLYCIRPRIRTSSIRGKEKSGCKVWGEGVPRTSPACGGTVRGVDGGRIWTLPYKDLEAVVSKVSLDKFGSQDIQKKAREDLGWIKEKAQLHEKAIEEAMGLQFKKQGLEPVIPMKFGTIFRNKKSLEETLKKHYNQFREGLARLKGRQEWAVKVYLDCQVFREELKKASIAVKEKEKEIARLPEGTAYFLQKQVDEIVSKEADKALQDYSENFFEDLKKYAETGTKGKILDKEITRKSLPMILNAIFLISEDRLEDFIKEIDKLNQECKSKGFNLECSGPWPPYSFI